MGHWQVDSKKRNRSRNGRPTIGFLCSTLVHRNAYATWHGVVDAAQERDINIISLIGGELRSPNGFQAQANVLYDLVSEGCIEGLVISAGVVAHWLGVEEISRFCKGFFPLPIVITEVELEGIPRVAVDFYQAMRSQLIHLIEEHGYCRIAFIRGPDKTHTGAKARYQAYLDVLAEYGLSFDPALVSPPSGWDQATGRTAMSLLLDERKVNFEAVVGANDDIAIGAMRELQTRGIHVPDNVAVVGFDDTADSSCITPPLTTLSLQAYEHGQQAVEMLLALLEGEEVPEQVIVPKLVIRQSCGCLDPVVEQATAGPVLAANVSFEAVVTTRREELLSEMAQVIGASDGGQVSAWAEQLLDAFVTELREELSGTFLPTLDEVLRQVIATDGDPSTGSGQDVAAWQNVLSVLRRYLLPYLSDDEAGTSYRGRAEDLWGQAGVMIGETAQRLQMYRRLQAEQQAQTLREIGQALITTFDVEELMNVLVDGLPRLGIPSCYLSLYENPKSPTKLSRLILAYDEKGRIELEPGGQVFPSRQLAPDGLLPCERLYNLVALPLCFREEQFGFVLFEAGSREGPVYDALRGEISSALQGVLLVERRRQAEEAMTKRATELELVAQVSAAVLMVLDTTELLERVATLTRDSFGLYHAHIYLLDEAGETLVLAAGAGSVGQQMVAEGWNIPYKQEQSLVARAARMKEGIIVNDVLTDPNWLPNPLLPDTRSELAVPLLVGERVLGVLDVQADEVERFTKDDIRIQSTLAAQVAVALENARLFEQGRENLTLTESLYQAGRRITAARDLQEIVAAVAEVTSRGNVNRVVLCGFEYDAEEEPERMIVQANWHSGEGTPPMLPETRYPRVMYPGIRQFLGSEPMIFGNIQHDKRFDATMQKIFQRLNIRAMAALPLWTGTRQTGVLLLQAEKVHLLSKEEIWPYASLMGQVTVAIENQRLLAETNAALAEVEATQRRYTIQAWEAYWARHGRTIGHEKTREALTPPEEASSPAVSQAVVEKRVNPASTLPASGEKPEELSPVKNRGRGQTDISKDQAGLVVPLTVRDEMIGVLGLQEGGEQEWVPEEIALVEAIGEQLAQAMENLRLIDETQQRVAREARIYEIGEKIQGAQSLEEALQIAIKEVGLSLKAPQTTVQLEVRNETR
jgi:GAF domain-containing protein